MSLQFSPEAARDLDDIYDYLASRNPAAAARVVQAIEQACRRLERFPGMGALRDDLRAGLRCFPSGKYVIFYDATNGDVRIIRVLHGSRDFTTLFNPP